MFKTRQHATHGVPSRRFLNGPFFLVSNEQSSWSSRLVSRLWWDSTHSSPNVPTRDRSRDSSLPLELSSSTLRLCNVHPYHTRSDLSFCRPFGCIMDVYTVLCCFYGDLRQWRRGNIALITTIPVLNCLNLVQLLQRRCLEDRFLPQQNKENKHH